MCSFKSTRHMNDYLIRAGCLSDLQMLDFFPPLLLRKVIGISWHFNSIYSNFYDKSNQNNLKLICTDTAFHRDKWTRAMPTVQKRSSGSPWCRGSSIQAFTIIMAYVIHGFLGIRQRVKTNLRRIFFSRTFIVQSLLFFQCWTVFIFVMCSLCTVTVLLFIVDDHILFSVTWGRVPCGHQTCAVDCNFSPYLPMWFT